MKQNKKKYRSKLACLLLACNVSVQADILTDGTVGDIYYLFGDNMVIPESYGTRVGDNLFHSFSMFNIYSGEAVTFTGSNTLQNVIARVTGGDVSMINGILSSNIGKANFYFINPAGVTFGKNAVVDVPAAFHVSTANQINFADGSVYSATNPAASTLTIAKPESFGFLGQTGDIVLDGAQIVAKPNQTIDLVANNITLKNDAMVAANEVRLVATKGSQNVSLVRDANGFLPLLNQMPNSENAGNILVDNSTIYASGQGSERIALWANNAAFNNNANLIANNNSSLYPGAETGINIYSNLLSLDNSLFTSSNSNIFIKVGSLQINNNAQIFAQDSSGIDNRYLGNITIETNGSIEMNNSAINLVGYTILSSMSYLSIKAASLKMDNVSFIGASPLNNGKPSILNIEILGEIEMVNGSLIAPWGNVNTFIKADSLQLSNTSYIQTASIFPYSPANLTIKVNNNLELNSGHIIANSFYNNISSGKININTRTLNVFNGGEISSFNFWNSSDSGDIAVSANNITIDRQGSDSLTGIFSATLGSKGTTNNSANIFVNVTGQLSLLGGGVITSTSLSDLGHAGDVTVNANHIFIDGLGGGTSSLLNPNGGEKVFLPRPIFPGISSDTFFGTGNAGNINVTANTINMINGGAISTESLAANASNGGNITINAKDYLYLENSRITTTTFGTTSNGGNINVNADVLVMNTGVIQANAEGGHGGDINLNVQALIPSYNSLIVGGEQVPWQPYIPGFNVIQAASETGVSGAVNISSPQFDISGSISGLKTQSLEQPAMRPSPCNLRGSSLKRKGKGGFPRNEKKYGFIPPVKELPNSTHDKTATESQNTPTSESQKPCAASVI